MAGATRISNAAAKAACDAITALLGSGGKLRIYDGTQATDPDTAVGSQVLLAELTLGSPAFPASVDIAPGARATANTITADASADNSGTATWFRAVTSGGTAVIDGNAGLSGATPDLVLNTTTIVAGGNVSVTSWQFTMPET